MLIARLRAPPRTSMTGRADRTAQTTMGEARLGEGKATSSGAVRPTTWRFWLPAASIGRETCCHGGPKRPTIAPVTRESGECRAIPIDADFAAAAVGRVVVDHVAERR